MHIKGLNKTTLLDYPEHLAATIFIGGCNMRCPFCHNASLVTKVSSQPRIPTDQVLAFLDKRKNILDGVCITGGEPTLYPDLPNLVKRIKFLGYKVKLDSNGTNPSMLKYLCQENLIDYIAMDIKNSKEKYPLSVGINDFDISPIEESVDFLLAFPDDSSISYEFRTTIVKQHHKDKDILSIGKWIKGARAYYLQAFVDSGDLICPGLSGHEKETMERYIQLLSPYVENSSVRGL